MDSIKILQSFCSCHKKTPGRHLLNALVVENGAQYTTSTSTMTRCVLPSFPEHLKTQKDFKHSETTGAVVSAEQGNLTVAPRSPVSVR